MLQEMPAVTHAPGVAPARQKAAAMACEPAPQPAPLALRQEQWLASQHGLQLEVANPNQLEVAVPAIAAAPEVQS